MQMVYTGASSSTTAAGCTGTGCIYIGTTPSFTTGIGNRPIFNGGGTMVGTYPGGAQAVVDLYGGYFVLDNIEFTGWCQLSGTEGGNGFNFVDLRGQHEEALHNYFSRMCHGGTAIGDNSQIFGGGAQCPADLTSSVHDNVADGSDTTQDMLMFIHPGARQSRSLIYLALLIGQVTIFYVTPLRAGHPWADDFGQYAQEAKNISAGSPYAKILFEYQPAAGIRGRDCIRRCCH